MSPRSHNYKANREYDVLICTDADGLGVNLQDADTVVNYDPPEGADELFQRAGRVLRMTAIIIIS
ncbi:MULTISPECIES: C-terminal helicase domain-containing protein [unclassified Nostoc]|uniref:C-terminal helicase domain-containing protein n=1 Tax=unclassified Nostoc TaxID=2593658 RepID=UPI00342FDA9C